MSTKKYGIYDVSEYPEQDGKWGGYKVKAIASTGKQGKLYIPKDGRTNYQAEPKKDSEELEL